VPKTWEVVHHFMGHMSINDNSTLTLTLIPGPSPTYPTTTSYYST